MPGIIFPRYVIDRVKVSVNNPKSQLPKVFSTFSNVNGGERATAMPDTAAIPLANERNQEALAVLELVAAPTCKLQLLPG